MNEQRSNLNRIHTKLNGHQYENFTNESKCILISDLTGSTSITRKYGVIHWASLVARMHQIILPIFYENCHAIFVGKEADDLIAIFNNSKDALAAACYMKLILSYHNEQIEKNYSDHEQYKINLGGIGLHMGKDIIINKTIEHIYGESYEYCFELGENTAENGEIILSEDFYENYGSLNANIFDLIKSNITLNEEKIQEDNKVEMNDLDNKMNNKYYQFSSNVKLDIFINIIKENNYSWPVDISLINDNKYVQHNGLLLLCKRHDYNLSKHEIEEIDLNIHQHYMFFKTSIMFNAKVSSNNMNDYHDMIKLMDKIYDEFDNNEFFEIGSSYLLFHTSNAALKCAIKLKNMIDQHNNNNSNSYQIETSGFGLHRGDILSFPEVFMQFGDVLNTASKIGEDLGEEGDIVITEDVKKDINLKENLDNQLFFQEKQESISGVNLKYYIVTLSDNRHDMDDYKNESINTSTKEDLSSKMKKKFKRYFMNPYYEIKNRLRGSMSENVSS